MNRDQFEGAAQDVAGKAQQAAGMVTGSSDTRVHGAVREVRGKAQHIYGDAREFADDVADRVGSAYERVRDEAHHAGDLYAQAQHGVRRSGRIVREQVGDRPLSSLLMAGAAGLLVGLLISARR